MMSPYRISGEEAVRLLSIGTWFVVTDTYAAVAVQGVCISGEVLVVAFGQGPVVRVPAMDIRCYMNQIEVMCDNGVALIFQEELTVRRREAEQMFLGRR